ncbi:MAG: glycosyltransferase family 39 protein, partial [Planctomycetota bacterium]
AHWAAGVYSWQSGQFDLYPVNPPLIRLIACFPSVLLRPVADFRDLETRPRVPGERLEWSASIGFVKVNVGMVRIALFLGRLTILPWVILGAWLSWRWAGELYGEPAACLAVALWCFSPSVLTWGGTIMPDLPAAASGLAAAYAFRNWLKAPGWETAVIAGVALGIAELTKMTWVILFAIWPTLWLLKLTTTRLKQWWLVEGLQCLTVMALGVAVINAGYGYSGTGERLGNLSFASRLLAGSDSVVDGGKGGNRFHGQLMGQLPIPLPRDYLLGADLQKLDFERGLPSYLCGQWSSTGWWYYYLVCCALKIPLGSWIVLGVSLADRLSSHRVSRVDSQRLALGIRFEELLLLIPAVCLFLLVSSQTGINQHFRYLLPAFPFVGVLASRAAVVSGSFPRLLVAGAILWNVSSSLWVFPHSMAYFNELAGGPAGGRRYLLHSNLDWGQDVWGLAEWCTLHPEASPLHVAFRNSYSEELLRSHLSRASHRDAAKFRIVRLDRQAEPPDRHPLVSPGWYAISVHRMHEPDERYAPFLRMHRSATIGHTFDIFHVAEDSDADRHVEVK